MRLLLLLLVGCHLNPEPVWLPDARILGAPVGIWMEPGIPSVINALATWNEATSCELFDLASLEDAQVQLVIGDDPQTPHNRYGNTTWRNGHAVVTISHVERLDGITAWWVVAHELGHAIGLDHDPTSPRSIMYPELRFDFFADDFSLELPYPTAKDSEAVRARYCP